MEPHEDGAAPAPTVIGIDIGKEIFHLVGFSAEGKVVYRRKIKRLALADTCCRRASSGWRSVSAPTSSAGRFAALATARGSSPEALRPNLRTVRAQGAEERLQRRRGDRRNGCT